MQIPTNIPTNVLTGADRLIPSTVFPESCKPLPDLSDCQEAPFRWEVAVQIPAYILTNVLTGADSLI